MSRSVSLISLSLMRLFCRVGVLLLVAASSCVAESKLPLTLRVGRYEFNLRPTGASGITISSAAGTSLPTPDVFPIEGPNRLVIDFPMEASKVMRSQSVSSGTGLRSVRVAGHPDKLRMVLDFGNNPIPDYELGGSSGTFLLTLGAPRATSNGADTRGASSEAPKLPEVPETAIRVQRIEPTATAVPTRTPTTTTTTVPPTSPPATAVFTTEPTAVPTVQVPDPTLAPTHTAIPSPSPTPRPILTPTYPPTEPPLPSTVQQLQTISFGFDGGERTPVLRLTLTQRPTFKTTRKDDRTYRILISNCRLARNSLSLPFYPPADFSGVTMAIAAPAGDDAEVIVSVDRGRRLTAVPRGTEILITSSDR